MEKKKWYLFRNGNVFDADSGKFQQYDFLVAGGVIEKSGKLQAPEGAIEVDLKGNYVVPGLLDLHVHLREPGREDEETIQSGAEAAKAGGFTGVCCMPNTNPPLDDRSRIEFVKKQATGLLTDVYPIGAVTKDRAGNELTEMGDMIEAGAVAFSDDGTAVATAEILRYALDYSRMFNVPIIDHCEDPSLSSGKKMNEGKVSTALGLPGVPTVAEDIIVMRDIMLAEFTGGHIHIAHISSAGSVRLVREAKKRGVRVTAEACPHHFVLTDEALRSFDTNLRVNPPIRSATDVEAVIEGLRDGTIDAIATDHAPHSSEEKDVEFDQAPPGMIGLETAVGLAITYLVKPGHLTLEQLIERMAIAPRQIIGLEIPYIKEGKKANFTVLDPNYEWRVDKSQFVSKSRNTPFDGWKLTGKAVGVFNNGQWYHGLEL